MKRSLNELLTLAEALDSIHRLRIIGILARGRQYVSELARQMGISRPLLYLHLGKLEQAGLVHSQLELSQDGKAMKYYEVKPFEVRLDPKSIEEAVAAARGGG
jgi:predicted transcriptional regulator